MVNTLEFEDAEKLETWLKDKPIEWAQAIAVRSALRVFPLVFSIVRTTGGAFQLDVKQKVILNAWRAVFVSWVASKNPTRNLMKAAAAAAAAAAVTSIGGDHFDTAGAANAAAVAAAKSTAVPSAHAHAFVAYAHTDQDWLAASADTRFLEAEADQVNAASRLVSMPLWLEPIAESERYLTNSPELTRQAFDSFANLDWVRHSPWQLMTNWYTAVLPNDKNTKPRSLFGEITDIEIAMQTAEFWEREPQVVLEAISKIVTGRSRENEDKVTVPQFIIDYLESVEDTATINEIRAAFVAAEYQVIDKTMRGTLSQLAKTGKIQRVETGVYAGNAWLLKRFDEVLETDEFLHASSEIIENLEPQAPAAFRFEWSDEKIVAQAPGNFTPDSETAQDLLDDVRRKALSLAERLERSNAEKRVRDSIQGLIDVLAERVADLRPGLLRSRSRSIEADAGAYAEPGDERELFPDAVAGLTDLSETLRDLQGCFPQLREIEAEIMALDIDPAKADDVKAHLDDIVDAVSDHENVVDQSAVYALHTMEGIASEDASPAVKQKRIAEYALVVRNFMSPLARFALENALSQAVTKATEDIWAKARPKIIDGVADGMGSMARPATIIVIASLVHSLLGPVAGAAVLAAGFGKTDRLLKLVDKWLSKSADSASDDEELVEVPEEADS